MWGLEVFFGGVFEVFTDGLFADTEVLSERALREHVTLGRVLDIFNWWYSGWLNFGDILFHAGSITVNLGLRKHNCNVFAVFCVARGVHMFFEAYG